MGKFSRRVTFTTTYTDSLRLSCTDMSVFYEVVVPRQPFEPPLAPFPLRRVSADRSYQKSIYEKTLLKKALLKKRGAVVLKK